MAAGPRSAQTGPKAARMKIESHAIPGPSGRLEALLTVPSPEEPSRVAVVCHPHPLFGGTMHNKVVFQVARALAGLGWPVLRFNFRGVGSSAGKFEAGSGASALIEAGGKDLLAALDWLVARFPGAVVCGAGFSFGARTLLQVAEGETRLERLLAVGTPAGTSEFPELFSLVSRLLQPKLFISGGVDPYAPREVVEKMFAVAAEPKRLVVIPEAGHFFDGHLDELRRAAASIIGLGV